MTRSNGKPEFKSPLDPEHELPQADGLRDEAGKVEVGNLRAVDDAESREAELPKLKAERDSLLDRLARLQAEFENARKRGQREQQEFRDYAAADTIKTFLPAMDSFERALKIGYGDRSSLRVEEFRSGIELIHKQFQDALLKLGLRSIPAKGEPFDPRVHEAIEMVDTSEVPDQQVLEELQRGYKLKERMLRPAMVKVARNHKHSG